jgi:hypothetical protein
VMPRPALTAHTLRAAQVWVDQSPPLRDVLLWHKTRCATCADWPVVCPEYDEIIRDYTITNLLYPELL